MSTDTVRTINPATGETLQPSDVFRSLVIAEPDVPAAMEQLITDPRVAAVSLTGSERAGAAVAAAAGRANARTFYVGGGERPAGPATE
jgi:succinate-semialdehyde dehydrogenase/glutarate-semialdehyde dehydrogenase